MIPGLNIILGGITGLVGNVFTTWFKFKNAKMEYDHDEKMVSLQTQAIIQKSQMQIQVAKTQVEGDIQKGDADAFTASQKAGNQKVFNDKWIDMIMAVGKNDKWYSSIFTFMGIIMAAGFAFVDWLNTLMRPLLTLYLILSSSYITYLAWQIMQKYHIGLTSDQAVGIFNQVTSSIIYLCVSAVTWWFGDRTMSKFLQQQAGKQNRNIMRVATNKTSPKKPGGGGDVDL